MKEGGPALLLITHQNYSYYLLHVFPTNVSPRRPSPCLPGSAPCPRHNNPRLVQYLANGKSWIIKCEVDESLL